MEKLYSYQAFSYEAREFAYNVLRASKHLVKLFELLISPAAKLFQYPKLVRRVAPGILEEVESKAPPNPGHWHGPPGKFF